jgi:orotate phosphoribosyltransferase
MQNLRLIEWKLVHGKATISSDKEVDYHVDLRQVTLDSFSAPLVGEVMLELTKDLDYEAVGGLILGADPSCHRNSACNRREGQKKRCSCVEKGRESAWSAKAH